MTSNFSWNSVKQLSAFQVLLAFVIPSAIAFFGFRYVLPWTIENGSPKVLMWGVIASIMLLILSVAGVLLIKKEATDLSISFRERILFKRISLKQWLICIGILVVGLFLSSGASKLVPYFEKIPMLAIPEYMPFWLNPSIDPMEADIEVLSPGYPLNGNILVVVIMGITLLLNIAAEEIYFRAWLLPKMNFYGEWSWVLNGLLFALYHTFQLWLFPTILVISLATTLTVYISKSIIPALVVHLVANFLFGILGIILLVFGA